MKLPSLLMAEKIEPKILLMDKAVVTLLISSFCNSKKNSQTIFSAFSII